MKSYTIKDIMKLSPCYSEEKVTELWDGKDKLSLLEMCQLDIPAEDIIWAVTQLMPDTAALLFSCDCSEHVLWIFESDCPNDNRVRNCIDTTRLWVAGYVDHAARDAACDAAAAAAAAAARDAAWDAACYAAWAAAGAAAAAAAGDAAGAAAWYAAGDAARAAAGDAARSAAGAATRDAACYAAWAATRDAAWDAAWAAEKQWQLNCLIGYVCER